MHAIEERTNKPWWNFVSFNFLAQWHGQNEEYAKLALRPDIERNDLIDAAQRSPIYVHSKYLTVDNNLMICGSANANERSMRGEGGDSEIAILNSPEVGNETPCQEQIISQREKAFKVTYGEEFVKKYPDCTIHPELYANEMRQKAWHNLTLFHSNTQSQSSLPHASPIMTWPFIYSDEIGHVGEYHPDYPNLIDTPLGMEEHDHLQWHPNHFPTSLRALEKLDIRLPY